MRLFSSPTTPFGRMATVMMMECGLQDRVQVVRAAGTPLDPGSMPLAQNPLGKIPTLELGDGRAIYDSRVICRYFDHLSASGFYPTGPALWDALTLEATAHGIAEAALLMAYESRLRPEELRFALWVEGQWQKAARALDAVESLWIDLLNGPLTGAHVALGSALEYLDFRHDARGWRAGRPRLAAWHAAFAERPAMRTTRPAA